MGHFRGIRPIVNLIRKNRLPYLSTVKVQALDFGGMDEALGFFAEQQYRGMRWMLSVQQVH